MLHIMDSNKYPAYSSKNIPIIARINRIRVVLIGFDAFFIKKAREVIKSKLHEAIHARPYSMRVSKGKHVNSSAYNSTILSDNIDDLMRCLSNRLGDRDGARKKSADLNGVKTERDRQ